MSPNTPTKQHKQLTVRPTYLGAYRTVENKEAKCLQMVPVMDSEVITSRTGQEYQRTLAGNLIKI